MLLGIDPLLFPDLLHTLASMGHGDRLAIVDANFPSVAMGRRVHQLPGADAPTVLAAVLTVLPLDDFVDDPALTMQVVGEAGTVPPAVADINAVLARHGGRAAGTVERFAFYEQVRGAFAVVQTGERRLYGNVIVAKGVVRS